jgi:hypothetical protein
MADGWVNLTVPRGNERELCSQGEWGYLPFRVVTANGVIWLVQVRDYTVPHFTKAGFAVAPDELQSAQPPQGPIRAISGAPYG